MEIPFVACAFVRSPRRCYFPETHVHTCAVALDSCKFHRKLLEFTVGTVLEELDVRWHQHILGEKVPALRMFSRFVS